MRRQQLLILSVRSFLFLSPELPLAGPVLLRRPGLGLAQPDLAPVRQSQGDGLRIEGKEGTVSLLELREKDIDNA